MAKGGEGGRPRGGGRLWRALRLAILGAAALLAGAGCDEFVTYRLWQGSPVMQPQRATIVPDEVCRFGVVGGSPPYRFSLPAGEGSLAAAPSGTAVVYTPPASPTQARVRVTDGEDRWAEAVVDVVGSLSIRPAPAGVSPGGIVSFSAEGGTPAYTFTLSGEGSLEARGDGTGADYTAPGLPTRAVVRVQDSQGRQQETTVTVFSRPLAILPDQVQLSPGNTFTFSASGGVPTYAFSIAESHGGSIGADSGHYTAPAGPVQEEVIVTDSVGNTSRAVVQVAD